MTCSKFNNYPQPNPRGKFVNACTMGGGEDSSTVHKTDATRNREYKQFDIEFGLEGVSTSAGKSLMAFPEYATDIGSASFFLGDGLKHQGNPGSVGQNPISKSQPTQDNQIIAPHFCTPLASKKRAEKYCNAIGDSSGSVYILPGKDVVSTGSDESNPSQTATRYGRTFFGKFNRNEWKFHSLPGADHAKKDAIKVFIFVELTIAIHILLYAIFAVLDFLTGGALTELAGFVEGAADYLSGLASAALEGAIDAAGLTSAYASATATAGAISGAVSSALSYTTSFFSLGLLGEGGILTSGFLSSDVELGIISEGGDAAIGDGDSIFYKNPLFDESKVGAEGDIDGETAETDIDKAYNNDDDATVTTRPGDDDADVNDEDDSDEKTLTEKIKEYYKSVKRNLRKLVTKKRLAIYATSKKIEFGTGLSKLLGVNNEWDAMEDGYSRKSCLYDDTNQVRYIYKKGIGGCCGHTCAIEGGTKLICQRQAYNGDPVVCCLNDFALDVSDRDRCFQTKNRQRTCGPRYRDLAGYSCIAVVYTFCSGQVSFEGQNDWTDLWSSKPININDLMNGDEYMANPTEFYKSTSTATYKTDDVKIEKSDICRNAMVRWMFPDQSITSWDILKKSTETYEGDIILNAADTFGLQKSMNLMGEVIGRYLEEGGSLFGQLDADGITNRNFVSELKEICTTTPSLCATQLYSICRNYKIEDMAENPNILEWCGCYLDSSEYDKHYGRYNISAECTPICNRDDVIPRITDNYTKAICTESKCIIDSTILNIISSSIGGNISFNQVCHGCTRYNNNFLNKQHTGQSPNSAGSSDSNISINYVVELSVFSKRDVPDDSTASNTLMMTYILYFGSTGVDFTRGLVDDIGLLTKLTSPDFKSKVVSNLNDTTIDKPSSVVCSQTDTGPRVCRCFIPIPDSTPFNTINFTNRTSYTVGLGIYEDAYNLVITEQLAQLKTENETEMVNLFSILSIHYICPVILLKAQISNNIIQISNKGKWYNFDSALELTDLTEYCFTLLDLAPTESMYDINYIINNGNTSDNDLKNNRSYGDQGQSNKGITNASLVLVVPLTDLMYDGAFYNSQFDFTLDSTNTKWAKDAIPHPVFSSRLTQQNLVLSLTNYTANNKVDLSKFSFNFSSIITKHKITDITDFCLYNMLSAFEINFNYRYNNNTINFQQILDKEQGISYTNDVQTCDCIMTDSNISVIDSKILGSLNLNQNCTGSSVCYNKAGKEVSCSEPVVENIFNITITNGGSGITTVDVNKLNVFNTPTNASKPFFTDYSVDATGKLVSLTAGNAATGYPDDQSAQYTIDFSTAVKGVANFEHPVAYYTVKPFDNNDPGANPNDHHHVKENVFKDYIEPIFKERYSTLTIVFGVFLFLCVFMFIALKPNPVNFKK